MKKKVLTIIVAIVVVLSTLTNVYAAESLFNLAAFKTAYRLSQESDIDLPFINVFSKGATYDKPINHSGISIGESTIDVDERLEGVHFIMAGDMITIKGEVEHGIIYGTNIVVEGKISGDTILMAEKVQILESAIVEKDLIVIANDFNMDGTIKGNLLGTIGRAIINGNIEKDLRIETASISLENGTVGEDVYISAPKGTDVTSVISKYPTATINTIMESEDTTSSGEKIANIVFDGLKVVIVYVIFGLLITRKENNIVEKATKRFIKHSTFGLFTGVAMLTLIFVVPVLLIILAICGLGVIAWPLLIVYVGLVLLSISISSFVVGMTLYETLKNKVGKYKIPLLVAIFVAIYAATKIPYISTYALLTINLISMAVIMSYIFKREESGKKKK